MSIQLTVSNCTIDLTAAQARDAIKQLVDQLGAEETKEPDLPTLEPAISWPIGPGIQSDLPGSIIRAEVAGNPQPDQDSWVVCGDGGSTCTSEVSYDIKSL